MPRPTFEESVNVVRSRQTVTYVCWSALSDAAKARLDAFHVSNRPTAEHKASGAAIFRDDGSGWLAGWVPMFLA